MAAKECRRCGRFIGREEHVELRVLDWEVEKVARGNFTHHRRKSRSLMSLVLCQECACNVMGKVFEGVQS